MVKNEKIPDNKLNFLDLRQGRDVFILSSPHNIYNNMLMM